MYTYSEKENKLEFLSTSHVSDTSCFRDCVVYINLKAVSYKDGETYVWLKVEEAFRGGGEHEVLVAVFDRTTHNLKRTHKQGLAGDWGNHQFAAAGNQLIKTHPTSFHPERKTELRTYTVFEDSLRLDDACAAVQQPACVDPDQIYLHPNGRFLFVSDTKSDLLWTVERDPATNRFTGRYETAHAGAGAESMAISETKAHALGVGFWI